MLSLIIPYYNDSGCPKPFVTELQRELKGIDYEIILVDDCSKKDSTPEELDALKSKKVKVIHNKVNKDYGGAIMTGFEIAKGDILGWTCGDGEVTAKDVIKVYKEMRKEDDILKAIRLNRQDGISRKFISKVFNIWSKLRWGLNVADLNGYPVFFKRECYQDLGVHNVKTNWIFNTDLFRKMTAKGFKIREVEVIHEKRTSGKSHMKPLRIMKMVWRFIKYK